MEYEFIGTFHKYKNEDSCSWSFLFMSKELAKEIRANHNFLQNKKQNVF